MSAIVAHSAGAVRIGVCSRAVVRRCLRAPRPTRCSPTCDCPLDSSSRFTPIGACSRAPWRSGHERHVVRRYAQGAACMRSAALRLAAKRRFAYIARELTQHAERRRVSRRRAVRRRSESHHCATTPSSRRSTTCRSPRSSARICRRIGHHGWKYIAFGPDGKLYVPIGAPCNVCNEPNYASITRMNPDGSGHEVFARGIRNTVGFTWHPTTKELWFTDNGRDYLGDDAPPCELNRRAARRPRFRLPLLPRSRHQGSGVRQARRMQRR